MSKFEQFKVPRLDDYSLDSRPSKVSHDDFARPLSERSIAGLIRSFPRILAARELLDLADRLLQARRKKRARIWGFGGHVIKVGLAPILIDLMEKGFVTALATNGSGLIHDFEIGWCGHTSEDVEPQLAGGGFGMARETGEHLNRAIAQGAAQGQGIGEAAGRLMDESPLRHPDKSLFLQAYRQGIPCTVHVALGTDTIHFHPQASASALGEGSMTDFRILTRQVQELDQGGVFVHMGSAVILPEVFLKAVSLVRNSGRNLKDFTTANLDFIQHYRPTQNVVRRPVATGGKGIALTGHHEILLPLLAAVLLEKESSGATS